MEKLNFNNYNKINIIKKNIIMTDIIFGWYGSESICNVLSKEFNDEDKKKIHNILYYSIQKKYSNGKDINTRTYINNYTIDKYKKAMHDYKNVIDSYKLIIESKKDEDESKEVDNEYIIKNKLKKYDHIIELYNIKYSAHNKLRSLQKYVDIINCKYQTNLNINFYYNKDYIFILYFGNPIFTHNNLQLEIINEFVKNWNRVKNNFNKEPEIYMLKRYKYYGHF
jgi:hypothetical protein